MLQNLTRTVGLLIVTLALFACTSHLTPSPSLAELHHKDFSAALRWKQYKVAASLMDEELRKPFLATFAAAKDLDIVDVRLLDIQFFDDNNRFEVQYEMDYVLLPSVTLKTFRFDQAWEFRQEAHPPHAGYVIVTAFPEFP